MTAKKFVSMAKEMALKSIHLQHVQLGDVEKERIHELGREISNPLESRNRAGSPRTVVQKAEEFEKAGVTLLEMKIMSWNIEQMKAMMNVMLRR